MKNKPVVIPNQKDIQRKLDLAQERLSLLGIELGKLEALVDPLNKKIAAFGAEKNYLLKRIEKLEGMLSGK